MPSDRVDLVVYAKDFPETRLVLEVKRRVSAPAEQDATVKRVAQHMWGANCHYGLVMTPTHTYVLRDDFTDAGPGAIHVTNVLSTPTLLSRVGPPSSESLNEEQLGRLAREWLQRLAISFEAALPDDAEVMQAFFPDIVGAVTDGRVVAEAAA